MKKDELIFLAIAATVLGASMTYEIQSQRWKPGQATAAAAALGVQAPAAAAAPQTAR